MKKKAKVALLAPRIMSTKKLIRRAQPPLGLACIAAVLEMNGHEVIIMDSSVEGYDNVIADNQGYISYGLPDEIVTKRLIDFSPDVIGISVLFSAQAISAYELSREIKLNLSNTPIVLGGIHASILYKNILESEESIDYILCGESDYTFNELITRYINDDNYLGVSGLAYREGSRIICNDPAALTPDLDDLPFPAWHLLDIEKYFEIGMPHNPFVKSGRVGCIMTSRGCPEKCYFCSSAGYFGGKFRPMSAARVIDLVKYLVKMFHIKEIQIEDDAFTLNYRRVIEICEGIKNLGLRITLPNGIRADLPKAHDKRFQMFKAMKNAGCEQIGISVEHGDQIFLNEVIGKRINLTESIKTCELAHKAGLLVHANFMMGFPFETEIQRQKTIKFARELDADSFSVSLVAPLPGTELWKLVEANGLFVDSFDENRIFYSKTNITPHDISAEDLHDLVDKLNKELNKAAQLRNPASQEKYKLFKGKDADGDRKYQI